ncbi:hypothetical protein T484DRAFT_1859025 [Baffinella frigidus]|nr:hypothetical protein T484DRAFT_1859025 [Cryptophyta sp. CCMP2293]
MRSVRTAAVVVCSLAVFAGPATAFAPAALAPAAMRRALSSFRATAPAALRFAAPSASLPPRVLRPGAMCGLRMSTSSSVDTVEAQIQAQGELVRTMKEANKAAPGAHSKEEITAAVGTLLALKAQLEAPPAEKKPEKAVPSATMPRLAVPDTLASSLALAAGRYKVKALMEADSSLVGKEVVVKGWVRTKRSQKEFSFIEVNDGSCPKGIQAPSHLCLGNLVVATADIATYGEVDKISTGAAVAIRGTLVESEGKGQKYDIKSWAAVAIRGTLVESEGQGHKYDIKAIEVELVGDCSAIEVELVGDCSGAEYPLQKKRHSLEFLRVLIP